MADPKGGGMGRGESPVAIGFLRNQSGVDLPRLLLEHARIQKVLSERVQ